MLHASITTGENIVVSDRLKVLVLADSRSFHTERYVRELVRQGCRVVTASLERGSLGHYQLKRRGPIRQLHYWLSSFEIRSVIKKFRPDIINPHFASGYGYSAALAVGKSGPPIVLVLWGSDILIVPQKSFLHRRKTTVALKRAKQVFGDSHYLLSAAKKLAPLTNSAVAPWGIERRYLAFHRRDYRLQKPLRIIVPRLHEPVYNNAFIIKALASLLQEGKVTVTFPSFGSLYGQFKRQAADISTYGIEFYDKMPRHQFLKFMSGFDLYLSASRSDSSPVSLIEAMALGLIPIAADIPGVAEWLTPESGYLFPENDTATLQITIEKIIREADPHETMRQTSLERVETTAIFESSIAEQIKVMKRLAGRDDG